LTVPAFAPHNVRNAFGTFSGKHGIYPDRRINAPACHWLLLVISRQTSKEKYFSSALLPDPGWLS